MLFKIARSGKFKAYKLRDTDLHMVLLTVLQTFRRGGNFRFWIDQMKDGSNKYYTNAAFYALLSHGYSVDILFKHMGTFISRFKGGIELVFGIESLFDYYEPKTIYRMFEKIGPRLSSEQKEAVNNAFTADAVKTANVYGIELKTVDLKEFNARQKELIQDFEKTL